MNDERANNGRLESIDEEGVGMKNPIDVRAPMSDNRKKQRPNPGNVGGKFRYSKKRVSKTRKSTKRYRRDRRHRRHTSRK